MTGNTLNLRYNNKRGQMLESAHQFSKQISTCMSSSTKKITLTRQILTQLQSILSQFSQKLVTYIDSFNKMIMKDVQGEDERLIKSFQIYSNSLLKVSDTFKKLSSNTKNAIIEPFGMFIENYKNTNKTLSKKVNDIIADLDGSRRELEIIKENSYQNWIKSDKAKLEIQKSEEKMEKGGKSVDLTKANENSQRLVGNAERVEDTYKHLVGKCNEKWKYLEKELESMCILFQYNEEARLSFERTTFTTALRYLGDAGLIETDIDKRIQESEELLKANVIKSPLHETMKSKYSSLFQEADKESFISYSEFKRQRPSRKQSYDPYKSISSKEKQEITLLVSTWLRENEFTKLTQDLEKAKLHILSNNTLCHYLIHTLDTAIKDKGHYYCKLEPQHFNDILNVLTLISRSLQYENQKEYPQLYKLINISLRLLKKTKSTTTINTAELMSSSLGKNSKTFTNQDLWANIFKIIQQKHNSKNEGSIVKTGFAFLNKIGDFVTGRDEEKQETDYFHAVKELTILMSSLSVPTEFSIPFIKKLLDRRLQAFEILKNILYTKQDLELRQRLTNPKQIIKHQQNKQLAIYRSKIVPIACLKILSRTGLLNQQDISLRLVCKQLQNVHKQIYHRLDIKHKWIRIMGCKIKDYSHLKDSIDQKSVITAVEEIITLDVNRSLHLHSEYLSPVMLHNLLRTFAYYNKDISYCQGMNYLVGYLFIKTRDEAESYSLFQKMMHTHFKELFLYQFQFMKIKMYQFQRLLSIFLPEISDHFKRQMISAECYIVSWMIALYSATYQYSLESYLVDHLWDKFITYGWRQFFKFTLWIFSLYKSQLLDMSFDRVLHFLGDLTKTELFLSGRDEIKKHPKISFDQIQEQIDKFHISNRLLEELKKDYVVAKRLEEK